MRPRFPRWWKPWKRWKKHESTCPRCVKGDLCLTGIRKVRDWHLVLPIRPPKPL